MALTDHRRGALGALAAAFLVSAALIAGVFLTPAGGPIHGQQGPGQQQQASGLVCSAFGGGPPYNFGTYEATRDRAPYLTAQRLAAVNALLPNDPAFALPPIEFGPSAQRTTRPSAAIPDTLLHAIGWIESRLNQGAIDVPYEGTGDVLISASCAYGLMQVASFFSNEGDVPSRAESLAGTHFGYNVAAGAQILVEKWNLDLFPVIGLGQAEFIESWYYAVWAYNGWATSNHPAGPEVDPFRSLPYNCDGPFNGYAYQELVLGCLRTPPIVDGRQLWPPVPVQLPDLAVLAQANGPLDPDHFFAGWAVVLAAPFTGAPLARPFQAMDGPLPPGSFPHLAIAMSADSAAVQRHAIFGSPRASIESDLSHLQMTDDVVEDGNIVVRNLADGLLVVRLIPNREWILVSRAATVAVGSPPAGLLDGSVEQIRVQMAADGLPAGIYEGAIIVEALLPNGSVQATEITVVLDKQGVPRYPAGQPRS
jgi:hypothetical protein